MRSLIVLILVVLLCAPAARTSGVEAQTTPSVVAGFHGAVYASGLSSPTAMGFGPDGRLYVAEGGGAIVVVSRGSARTIAAVGGTPLGLAWHGHTLYVSSTGRVTAMTPSPGYRSFSSRVIISGLPTGRHQNDGMAFTGSWIYLGVGSTCNACAETDPRSASIMRFHLDGSHAQIYARGLRNPYGLAVRPGTTELSATDNGRDDNDQIPDELNRIVRGRNYGWPNCWGAGGGTGCRGTVAPVALFEPHSSADGIAFYTGQTFPARYRHDAFVAEWGAEYGPLPTGHRVKDVHFSRGKVSVSDFATGLSHPLTVTVAPDGSLLAADNGTGVIWRFQANGH